MRRVAEQAGCAPSALYRYFPSKRALLRFIWEEVFADLSGQLHRPSHASTTPLQRLGEMALIYLNFWLDRSDDFRAIFLIQDREDSETGGFFAQTSKAVQDLQVFTKAIEHAQNDGSLTQRDPLIVRDILLSALQGVLMNVITIPEYAWTDPKQLGRLTLEVVLRGLGAPAEFSLTDTA